MAACVIFNCLINPLNQLCWFILLPIATWAAEFTNIVSNPISPVSCFSPLTYVVKTWFQQLRDFQKQLRNDLQFHIDYQLPSFQLFLNCLRKRESRQLR